MQVDFLEEPISAFVRLSGPLPLGDLTEVSLETRFQKSSLSIISQRKEVKRDTLQTNHGNNVVFSCRFLFILLGPPGAVQSYHEIGRAMAASFADEVTVSLVFVFAVIIQTSYKIERMVNYSTS